MLNFVNYTTVDTPEQSSLDYFNYDPLEGITISTQTTSTEEPAVTTEPATTTTSPVNFSWITGGAKEKPYSYTTATTTKTTQPTQQFKGRDNVVSWALSKVGSPYVWGAKGQDDSFDCSGLIYAAYKANGIDVPTSTQSWLSSNKTTVEKTEGQPGDVIITGSKNSKSGHHARLITRNLGNGKYECVEAKGKDYGVVTSVYSVDNDLKNIYRAKQGIKLIKKQY